jgi:RimJ/RimL family protein N-acetyltransferase
MNIIETERLILREFAISDASFLLKLLNTPTWLEFIGNRGVTEIDEAEDYIQEKFINNYQKIGFGFYLVALKNGNIPIGMCGLVKRNGLEDVDIGFAFLPNYEKKGYGFEAASATLNYAKTTLKLQRVVAITTEHNINSIQLLKKIGLQFEKMIDLAADDRNLMLFATV